MHLWLVDAAAAGVITVMHTIMVFDHDYGGPKWFGVLLALAIGPPIAVRRRWPLPVWTVVLVASAVATAVHLMLEPYSALAFALYLVALATPANRAVPALALSLAVPLVTLPLVESSLTDAIGLVVVVWLVQGAVWTAGVALRKQRAGLARERDRQAQQALADERLRIARELHDIVAHSMSVISVKAAVANHVAETHPDEARAALAVIEQTSRQALTELRTMLGVLRSSVDDASLAPSVGGLAALAEQARLAGVRVDLTESGTQALPEGIMLAVHRIVQESLTNVVRHAAPAHCTVRVDADAKHVLVEVLDDGPGTRTLPRPGPGTGHGLIGMRERVALYDGTFEAGPRPGGGFAVRAALPYREDA
ncbi:signal transduction histidine kinase [Labedaea rhizosphaerae]|uniref:histidine kinase n=1 Tax=Labedaea rhizosphaerae TaxID=598644 RepID=A0A4R6S5X1_LABRH|nr:signal transduction histidine kinase [Labedaea rhizosphaerae]